nr:integrase, catalytic region, zinc finger, CCHC-type, peptidase aspartic, catalytic [Tanacetum cinerariifolium]
MILIGQKNTLAEYMILSGADNRPPMLDKDLFAKDLWEIIQLLMQGTSLTKQEKECKLYDAFDKFAHIKGESFHQYYLRFTQLINDTNIYKIKLEQFQVNTKFLNSLPPEWNLAEFPQIDSGLAVPVFKQGNEPIDAINKMMSFLSTVVSSCFPTTKNQLRNSSNPRQQATIHDGRVTVQPVQRRQGSFAASTSRTSGNNSDPGIAEGPVARTVITHNATYQADDMDAYDFDCDDFSTAKEVLIANLSKNEITSDSNIIPYPQYLLETQNGAVQDTNSSAQQDAIILSMFEQLSNQVTNCNKVNKDNLMASESLSAELERYEERVKYFNSAHSQLF